VRLFRLGNARSVRFLKSARRLLRHPQYPPASSISILNQKRARNRSTKYDLELPSQRSSLPVSLFASPLVRRRDVAIFNRPPSTARPTDRSTDRRLLAGLRLGCRLVAHRSCNHAYIVSHVTPASGVTAGGEGGARWSSSKYRLAVSHNVAICATARLLTR